MNNVNKDILNGDSNTTKNPTGFENLSGLEYSYRHCEERSNLLD